MVAHATYFERYMAGEHEQVWAELQALGVAVRESALYGEALAVAQVTMQRVHYNLELLIPRLQTIGYSFGDDEWKWAEARQEGKEEYYLAHRPQSEPVIAPPSLDVTAQLAEMETLRGHIPLSVIAWYQVVGSVEFTGLAPEQWWRIGSESVVRSGSASRASNGVSDEETTRRAARLLKRRDHTYWLDPISFWSLEYGVRRARFEDGVLRGEFGVDTSQLLDEHIPVIPMAPDMHSKYNYSGGGPFGVRAPDPSMDGLFKNDLFEGSFVDYLRLCCRHAGLPGLRHLPRWIRDYAVPARVDQIEQDIRYLTEGLLPF